MKKKLIAGNWKMNGNLTANAKLLGDILAGLSQPACDVAVGVPAVYLAQCQSVLAGTAIDLASQDVSSHEAGAYTGEIPAGMPKVFGVRNAILGH